MNIAGAFFNRTYNNGQVLNVGTPLLKVAPPPPYPGNTPQAQFTIMLHEFGHLLDLSNSAQHDADNQPYIEFNDMQVNGYCGTMIAALPGITGPASGEVGHPITITGLNFGSSQGTNSIYINGVNAGSASNWATSSITVTVPSGAVGTGNIVITVSGVPATGPTFTGTN